MDFVTTLQKLEPLFIEAGRMAHRMQKGVFSYNKFETGNPAGDIVTEADLAVQEFLLTEISKTNLIDCNLLAEEETPSTRKFNRDGNYYLGIDPIDDTAIYAKGGEHFSTIVTLHDGKEILYTFVYFPAWDWTNKVIRNNYSVTGKSPDISLPAGSERTIVYWSGSPEKTISAEILKSLESKNIIFKPIVSISGEYATIGSFITNKVAGVYHQDMNAYDGLVEFNIAQAKGRKVYSSAIDLANVQKRESGFYYPGYYLALNDVLSGVRID